MVGDPKTLSDLARIEADVRVRCRKCGLEEDWSIESLRQHLKGTGGSEAWSEIARTLYCRRSGCGGRDLRVLAVPFSRRPPNMPREIPALQALVIDLAMKVLADAAYRSRQEKVGTVEVRLALYVLHPLLADAPLVRACWHEATRDERAATEGMPHYVTSIRRRLVVRGWLLPEPELVRPKVWQWSGDPPDETWIVPGRQRGDG